MGEKRGDAERKRATFEQKRRVIGRRPAPCPPRGHLADRSRAVSARKSRVFVPHHPVIFPKRPVFFVRTARHLLRQGERSGHAPCAPPHRPCVRLHLLRACRPRGRSRSRARRRMAPRASAPTVWHPKGCRPDSDTTGIESFGEYVQLLVQTLPITTKDLNYPPELPKLCGSYTGDCLRVLLKRVQDGALENDSAVLYEASRRWLKRQLQIREEEHG